MVFREVSVIEIREVLRSWLAGAGLRTVAAQAGVGRKTARRYVEAAVAAGLARDGGLGQLSDELVGQVAEAVRPVRPGGHGPAWECLEACRAEIQAWVKQGLTVVKIGVLLERQGVAVPYRTLHRFCAERCGYGRAAATTVRVADGEPGAECQLDFGYLGLLADPVPGRQRKVHALIFTACIRGTCSCGCRSPRRWPRSSPGARARGGSSAACSASWFPTTPPRLSRARTRSIPGSPRGARIFACSPGSRLRRSAAARSSGNLATI
jgi:hypothetical protein